MGDKSGVPLPYWESLLRFAQRIQANDPVNQPQNGPRHAMAMSQADREWLQAAMSDLVKETDPVTQMKRHLATLYSIDLYTPSQVDCEKGVAALEGIADLCGHMDCANDFHKINGYRIILPLLSSPNAEFRAGVANLMGELAQNNVYSQERLHELDVLDVLLEILDSDPVAEVKTKALFAISCIIRHASALEDDFIQHDGLSHLLRALQVDCDRLQTKALFLLTNLLKKTKHKEIALSMGFVEQIMPALCSPHMLTREMAARALLSMVTDYRPAQMECRRPQLDLKTLLQLRIADTKDQASLKDEHDACMELIELIWGSGRPVAVD